MGKRSTFPRRERDFYQTPEKAVLPLLPHLPHGLTFDEPCAGNGKLVRHLEQKIECKLATDIEPQGFCIQKSDVFDRVRCHGNVFITNPPWSRDILHPLIEHLSDIAPTWLLFDADWMHTRQSAPFMYRCIKIVSVGRLKWIPDSKMTGKDNCAWYLFDAANTCQAQFFGRTPVEIL